MNAPRTNPAWWTTRRGTFGAALLLGLLIFGWDLGVGGFAGSEAHRAVPAYEMLASGDWTIPTMFGQPYLRKPPGMPWAIAMSSAVFGPTEFAARLVSATSIISLALASAWFARRWFGARAGLAAALAVILLPWTWAFGRSAEIEALNHLGTGLAALGLVDLCMTSRRRLLPACVTALGTAVLLLAKGPAGAAVPASVLVACALVARSWHPVRSPWPWISIALGTVPFVTWMTLAAASVQGDAAVTQSPGAFLWSEPPLRVLTLTPIAWLSALPASFALLFPWGGDADREAAGDADAVEGLRIARVLTWAWLLANLGWLVAGVGNPRYTLPAATLVAPIVGWVIATRPAMTSARQRIAAVMRLGPAWVLPALLLTGWGVYLATVEQPLRQTSAGPAGSVLAESLARAFSDPPPRPVVVLADGVIESRPEAVLALIMGCREQDPPVSVEVHWFPGLGAHAGALAVNGLDADALLLRTDPAGAETGVLSGCDAIALGGEVRVHKDRARLYRISPRSPDAPGKSP